MTNEESRMPDPENDSAATAIWPVCPECGKRRHTSCPVCGTSGNQFPLGDTAYPLISPESGEADAARPLLICPTCDEPFEAAFLRLCEWCDHNFGDGVARPESAGKGDDAEPFNLRVWLVMAGLGGTVLAGLAYFLSIAG
ncbi:MAG: hypothetical protein ACC645_09965 [Pirellulales bacterium]